MTKFGQDFIGNSTENDQNFADERPKVQKIREKNKFCWRPKIPFLNLPKNAIYVPFSGPLLILSQT